MTNGERQRLMHQYRIPSTKLVTYDHSLPRTLVDLLKFVWELIDMYGDAPFEVSEYEGGTIMIDSERHLTIGEINFEIARRQKLEQLEVADGH